MVKSQILKLPCSFLPARMGGLCIRSPVDLCDIDFTSSLDSTAIVSDVVRGCAGFDWSGHLARLHSTSVSRHQDAESWYNNRLHQALEQFPEAHQRAVKRAVGGGISHWLTTLPLDRYHFDLAAVEFRDALALHYLRTPLGLPRGCDDCRESFSLQHGLGCPKGVLVIRQHNEIRVT